MENEEMDETQVRARLADTQEEALLLGNTLLQIVQEDADADTVRMALSALTRTSCGMQLLHTNPIA